MTTTKLPRPPDPCTGCGSSLLACTTAAAKRKPETCCYRCAGPDDHPTANPEETDDAA